MSETIHTYQGSTPKGMGSPDDVLRSMEGLGITDTGKRCEVKCAEIQWKQREESREPYYVVGEPHECGGRIFFSKKENKKLPCGLCAIRGADCIGAVVRLKWKEKGNDPVGTEILRSFTNKLIIYSGFDGAQKFIFDKAEVKFKYQYEEHMIEKQKREQAAREREEQKKKYRMKL